VFIPLRSLPSFIADAKELISSLKNLPIFKLLVHVTKYSTEDVEVLLKSFLV
jgi:hypothetical protein